MGIFSRLFSGSNDAPNPEAESVRIDESALPDKVRESLSALKDFKQLFVEDKRYEATKLFPGREAWLKDFGALVKQLSADPLSADIKEITRLEAEAAKMEKSMNGRSVNIPGGMSISIRGEDGKWFVSDSWDGMEGVCVARDSFVQSGKRHVSIQYKLLDGTEILVREEELKAHGGERRASSIPRELEEEMRHEDAESDS